MSDKYLVTGAAGFIGSNLVEAILKNGDEVVGLDSFVTGKRANIEQFLDDMQFVEGDVRDLALCRKLCQGVDFVLHEAAIGSVPRSVDDPIENHENNLTGTLNMLVAARDAEVKRFVFAASSAAYGNTDALPIVEALPMDPLSPYAVTKCASELYCKVFYGVYDLPTVGLRYFNVFGPRQDPEGMYAAVIPKFIQSILRGERPVIFGDGGQTRDFCHVDNVVKANLLACKAPKKAWGGIFNVGVSSRISLNELTGKMLELLGSGLKPEHGPGRTGDIRHSQADISLAREMLGFEPEVGALEGLEKAIGWYKENLTP